jgi:RNA polymerase sigma-70 factor, ECF subfamily
MGTPGRERGLPARRWRLGRGAVALYGVPVGSPRLVTAAPDQESAEWLRSLGASGHQRDEAVERLHALLVSIARHELRRRRQRLDLSGPEVDDLAHQAAADALLAIMAKLDGFRGESRFTTWAFRFVILEVSTKLGRHFWRRRPVALDEEDWEQLPARFGFDPQQRAEWHDLLIALRRAVDHELTPHQRRIFVAIVLQGIPLDALVTELGSNRNAIYKSLFDARRKLRRSLAAAGYTILGPEASA